jgi:hypothetical protein
MPFPLPFSSFSQQNEIEQIQSFRDLEKMVLSGFFLRKEPLGRMDFSYA